MRQGRKIFLFTIILGGVALCGRYVLMARHEYPIITSKVADDSNAELERPTISTVVTLDGPNDDMRSNQKALVGPQALESFVITEVGNSSGVEEKKRSRSKWLSKAIHPAPHSFVSSLLYNYPEQSEPANSLAIQVDKQSGGDGSASQPPSVSVILKGVDHAATADLKTPANVAPKESTIIGTEKPEKEQRTITWKMRETCPAEATVDPNLPPKLSGFSISVFNQHRNLLTRTFVPVAEGDPFGCQEYRYPLAATLPANIPIDDFRGSLSISGMTLESTETGEMIWRNFHAPIALALETTPGTGWRTITWDATLERFERTFVPGRPIPGTKAIRLEEISHYWVHYGRKSRAYDHVKEVRCGKLKCSVRLEGLEIGTTWYGIITTVLVDGLEGELVSEEFSFNAKE